MKLMFTDKKVAFLLLVLTLALYGNTVFNDFSLDDSYIVNQIPRDDKSIVHAFIVFKQRFDYVDYRPIPMFTFAVEQSIFGKIVPSVSHGINVLFFYLVCCAVYLFVSNLPVPNSRLLGLVVAILFVSHPIHANTVNNLKSRDTLMSCLFGLLSILFWIKSLQKENVFNLKYVFVSMLFYLLSVFCKLDSVPIILILFVIFILFKKQQKLSHSLLFILLFFLAIYILRRHMINVLIPAEPEKALGVLFMENPIVNSYTLSYRIGQSVMVLFWYIKFMIVPFGYYFYFGYNTISLYPATHVISILLLLFHLSITGTAFYFILKKKDKIIGFGILFFLISITYCLNIVVPVAGIVADRYAFIASLGYCIVVGTLLLRFADWISIYLNKNKIKKSKKDTEDKMGQNKKGQIALIVLLAVITLFYLPFVWSRNAAWKNMLTLLESDMPHLEHSYEANRIATKTYLDNARFASSKDSAVYFYKKGLQTATQANTVYPNEIFILESMGISNMATGQPDKGIDIFRKVISLTDSSLVSCDAYGDYLLRKYQFDSSAYYYYKTIQIAPDDPESYYKYMAARIYNKQYDILLQFADSILEKRPKFYPAYECKGFAYLNMKDTVSASSAYLSAFDVGLKSPGIARLFRDYYYRKNNVFLSRKFLSYANKTN